MCARVDVLIIKLILLGTYWSTNKGRRIGPREAGSESNPWDGVIDQSQASSKTINSFLFIHSQGKERKEKKRKEKKRKESPNDAAPRFIHSFIPLLRWLPHIAAAATHRLVSHVAAGHGLRPLPLPLPHRRRTHPPLITSPLLSSQEKRREEVRSGGGGGGGGPDPPRSPRASTASARRDMASDDAAVNPRYSTGMQLPCALLVQAVPRPTAMELPLPPPAPRFAPRSYSLARPPSLIWFPSFLPSFLPSSVSARLGFVGCWCCLRLWSGGLIKSHALCLVGWWRSVPSSF